jgi:hypothetical protein
MLEVGIELDYVLDRKLAAPNEAFDSSDAAASRSVSIDDDDFARVSLADFLRNPAGPIRRLIVDHDDAGVHRLGKNLLDAGFDVSGFIVGGEHCDNAHV